MQGLSPLAGKISAS